MISRQRDPMPLAEQHSLPDEVRGHWRLDSEVLLGARKTRTWRVNRGGMMLVVKHFGLRFRSDWRYQLKVAERLRQLGWPTPAVAEEPLIRPDGAWVLFDWLPGSPADPADQRTEERARGRLLAEFHQAAADSGIDDQRAGFTPAQHAVADPELDHWLAVHEKANPDDGRLLRSHRDALVEWFSRHPVGDAWASVIHGDFARWNLLFDRGRLTGVLDFEVSHHNLQVADFALAWRGDHDPVIAGYNEVRQLCGEEWRLIVPLYWAWLYIGVKDDLAEHYGRPDPVTPFDLSWQIRHLRKRSELLQRTFGCFEPAYPIEG